MLATRLLPRRWVLAAAVGLAAALAFHLVQRLELPREPELICVIPDVDLTQRYPAPSPMPDRRVVIADLLSVGSTMPDCGTSMFETTMVFTETAMVFTDTGGPRSALNWRVLVPCAEMPRPMYSPTAGDAPRLQERARYRLELSRHLPDDSDRKNASLWRADRIDVVQEPGVRGVPAHRRPGRVDMAHWATAGRPTQRRGDAPGTTPRSAHVLLRPVRGDGM